MDFQVTALNGLQFKTISNLSPDASPLVSAPIQARKPPLLYLSLVPRSRRVSQQTSAPAPQPTLFPWISPRPVVVARRPECTIGRCRLLDLIVLQWGAWGAAYVCTGEWAAFAALWNSGTGSHIRP